ncbi:hypothetical protein WICMUC_002945 [Wickerhamomyces mucosus]|uniref:SCP2 domain-containing protein n=1 Tax=Wickerhamomyces mucosus TaxID=1378264 RepID=A0A9P8PNW5_9ASCO|nr:hypothetical protein WICMUC_002945 [Wickerhamomyces mucosus]
MVFKSDEGFKQIEQVLSTNESLAKDLVKKTKAIIVFTVKNKQSETKHWKLDLKSSSPTLKRLDKVETGDLNISLNDLDFKRLVDGKANSQKLFLSGKLKVKGDLTKASSIESILKAIKPKAKL